MNQQGIASPKIRTIDIIDATKRTLQEQESSFNISKKKNNRRLYTQREQEMQNLVTSPLIQIAVIIMVAAYALLIFVIVALEDILTTDQYTSVTNVVDWFELGILILFLIEIQMNIFAWTLKKYYSDKWMILDTLIILLSLFFVIFTIITEGLKNNVIKIFQIIFRFLRIFLLIRKAQTFKKIDSLGALATPAEKITRFLSDLKDLTDSTHIRLDIEYCVDKISNNQLYEMGQNADDDQEMIGWINGSNQNHRSENKRHDTMQKSGIKKVIDYQKLKIPKKLLDILVVQHDDLYINPFDCDKFGGGESLVHLMLFLFEFHDLFEVYQVKPKVFKNYFTKIMQGYQDNLYHNRIHAFDVCQTTNFLISKCKFIEISQLDEQDISCIFLAAAAHDYGHPGYTNAFMINSKSDLAFIYNDQSVLENYHSSQAFSIALQNEKCNIFDKLSFFKERKIRESITSMILSTDMAHHSTELALTKTRIASPDFDPKQKDKQRLMDLIVHCSDVSNPIKSYQVYQLWTERVLGEFWLQGDKEKQMGLPVSYLCDRTTTNTASAQLGYLLDQLQKLYKRFIDYVVKPTFAVVLSFLPSFEPYFQNLDKNRLKWADLVEFYQKQLNK